MRYGFSRMFVSLFLVAAIGAFATERNGDPIADAEVVLETPLPPFSFVTYIGAGVGAFLTDGRSVPQVEWSSGFQLTPWLAIGGRFSASPLSAFEHADFGVDVASADAAYLTSSGTELLFTPWAEKAVHPLLMLTLGGASVGRMEDIDDEEGYDAVYEERCFSASASAGAELNLSRHVRLVLRGGWRFVANDADLGLDELELSGPEASATVRVLWRTSFE